MRLVMDFMFSFLSNMQSIQVFKTTIIGRPHINVWMCLPQVQTLLLMDNYPPLVAGVWVFTVIKMQEACQKTKIKLPIDSFILAPSVLRLLSEFRTAPTNNHFRHYIVRDISFLCLIFHLLTKLLSSCLFLGSSTFYRG